jgi:hypothetical protein
MKFPWYGPPVKTEEAFDLRFEVQLSQDAEIANLKLVNEFLRTQIAAAERNESRLLKKSATA